jgi:dTDP-4-dehydrorhamnose 3,5-epimerase
MRFTETPIDGAWLIDVEPRGDDRGFFARAWCQNEFDAHGLTTGFVQCNLASSRWRGTLRGLHYQAEPHGEVKLARCIRGAIFDAIVDLRPGSSTYLRWFGAELSAENHRSLYVPAGCAHGYQALTDDCEVLYPVSAFYAPESERGVRWNDPAFGIEWPIEADHMSAKDRSWPDFSRTELP